MHGRYQRYAVYGHGLGTTKRSSAGRAFVLLRDEDAVVISFALRSMQERFRARNLLVLDLLQLGDIGLAIEPQCPVTTYSSGVAVLGCTMPRASIHTNHARPVDVDDERLMEPFVMEVHVNKAVLRFDVCRDKCNCRTKWNWLVK